MTSRLPARPVQPSRDLLRVESEQVSPLDEWNATLSDKPPHVTFRHAEMISNLRDVEQARKTRTMVLSHTCPMRVEKLKRDASSRGTGEEVAQTCNVRTPCGYLLGFRLAT